MKTINIRTTGYVLACGLLLTISATAQANNEQTATAQHYVDSIHNWGSWELGLEPAAGGPAALPERALANRPANVRFRPNDNSVFGTPDRGLATAPVNPSSPPVNVPGVTAPGVAPPGSPGDRFKRDQD